MIKIVDWNDKLNKIDMYDQCYVWSMLGMINAMSLEVKQWMKQDEASHFVLSFVHPFHCFRFVIWNNQLTNCSTKSHIQSNWVYFLIKPNRT